MKNYFTHKEIIALMMSILILLSAIFMIGYESYIDAGMFY